MLRWLSAAGAIPTGIESANSTPNPQDAKSFMEGDMNVHDRAHHVEDYIVAAPSEHVPNYLNLGYLPEADPQPGM